MGDELDYDDLDPGIRETVRRLREWGFPTTDSGDGQTKSYPGVRGEPHVVMVLDHPAPMIALADSLREMLISAGIPVGQVSETGGGVEIQASYDPANGGAIIDLSGLSDDMWPGGGEAA